MTDRAVTVGSLFSGVGGLDLGLERAGMRTKWFVEIDPFCRRVLAKHWPDVPCYEDVRDVGAHNLEPVDLIAGGFPCQDISYAGKGVGLEGARSGLWYEFARIIGEMGPRYVVVENVPALLARGLGDVLGTLASLGYDAEWDSLPASAFGAPHLRDRVFVCAHPIGNGGHARCFFPGKPDPSWRQSRLGQFGRMACPDHWREAVSEYARRDDGTANRVDRLRALGNAVVPQVAEYIGRRIIEAHDRPGNQDS